MSLVRRVQLAVTAHIRHVYTDYDFLLKIVTWPEARRQVEKLCLDRLILWRGDDEDPNAMEDILREVIVIPDDDEDDETAQDGSERKRPDRSGSVVLLTAEELQTQPVNYATSNSAADVNRSPSPESDEGRSVQYMGRAPLYHDQHRHLDQGRKDRMEAHRHRVWEEAIDRRRRNPNIDYSAGNHASPSNVGTSNERPPFQVHAPLHQSRVPESEYRALKPMKHASSYGSSQTRLVPLHDEMPILRRAPDDRFGFSDPVSPMKDVIVDLSIHIRRRGER